MSAAFGTEGFAGFSIHSDESENANALRGKTKREDIQGKPPANKRAALCALNTNTRVQPHRAAKQNIGGDENFGVLSQENGFAKGAKTFQVQPLSTQHQPTFPLQSNPFAIHVDESLSHTDSENTLASLARLHPSVTSLRQPLSSLVSSCGPTTLESHHLHPEDSPMLLDESVHVSAIPEPEDTSESRFQRVLTCPEYSPEIYTYLREAELRNRPKPSYMRKQPDVTSSMRSILIDWLVEVAEEYKLHRETLCLAVNYIDRFLSQMSVVRGKLQLVGAACVFLAAKYEEIYPPDVGEFVYITDDTYTSTQVLRMEHLVLKVLSFDVAIPTFNCFCEKFLKDMGADETTSCLAMYLAELTMIEAEPFLKFLPSVIAASGVCLANITRAQEAWPEVMVRTTGYQYHELADCMHHMYSAFCQAPQHPQQSVREKYKQDKYHQVATLTPPPSLPTVMIGHV